MNETQIRDILSEIDDSTFIEVTSWEAGFLEGILYRQGYDAMTKGQKEVAEKIIGKYEHEL